MQVSVVGVLIAAVRLLEGVVVTTDLLKSYHSMYCTLGSIDPRPRRICFVKANHYVYISIYIYIQIYEIF